MVFLNNLLFSRQKPGHTIVSTVAECAQYLQSVSATVLLYESLAGIPQSVAQIERYMRNSHRLLHNNVDIKCQRQ